MMTADARRRCCAAAELGQLGGRRQCHVAACVIGFWYARFRLLIFEL